MLPIVTVLGRDTCSDSTRLRAHLGAEAIEHDYRDVELDPAADRLIRSFNGGERVTPTVLLGDPANPWLVLIEPSDQEFDEALGAATLEPAERGRVGLSLGEHGVAVATYQSQSCEVPTAMPDRSNDGPDRAG